MVEHTSFLYFIFVIVVVVVVSYVLGFFQEAGIGSFCFLSFFI